MESERLILITNPGSSSRKYALYKGMNELCSLHFEFEGKKIVYTLKSGDQKKKVVTDFKALSEVAGNLEEILIEEEFLGGVSKLSAILARVVAPGAYFANDHIVDKECFKELEIARTRAPLHVPVVMDEIIELKKRFDSVPVIEISDSNFHNSRPELAKAYCIDQKLAEKFDIKKWGFHGLSVGSVVRYMKQNEILPERLVVCHIGSGASITAVYKGKSHDTTMGYTPLEGVMMATRTGSMDVAAAMAMKRALKIEDDVELERYLNKQCGLLGVSGVSDDLRTVIQLRDEGDKMGSFAYSLYIYRLQACISQMIASMGGVDALVFTATIGERSDDVRRQVIQKMKYLGLELDAEKNTGEMPERHTLISSEESKPIYVVRTDETSEMIERANLILAD